MATIAFIGLGIMGAPMAGHLVRAATSVVGYNRSRGPVDTLIEPAVGASSVAEAVTRRRRVFTMVPDSPDVLTCARTRTGSSPTRSRARFTSTCPPSAPTSPRARQRPARKPASGCRRPGRGGEAGASDAALSIMVGGEADDFDAAKPILEVMGKTSCCRAHGRRPDRQGREPAHRRRQLSSRSPRPSSSSRRTAWTPRPRSRCSAADWPAPRCWTGRGQNMLDRSSSPASESTCTTRTWASSPPPRARPGVVIPLGAVVAQLMAALAPRATAGSTTPACCAVWSDSPAKSER